VSMFGGEDLFSSGPHRFHIGGVSLRHVLQETVGGRGVQLSPLGRHGRSITQTGDLVADDADGLRSLSDAVEQMLDGRVGLLVDPFGQSWLNTVMLSFAPEPMVRVGGRVHVSYTIQYLQLTP